MDRTALQKLDYGLYVLTAVDGGRGVGCVVSAVTPLATADPQLTVSLHRENFTAARCSAARHLRFRCWPKARP